MQCKLKPQYYNLKVCITAIMHGGGNIGESRISAEIFGFKSKITKLVKH